jgi:hypothetical protein
MAVGTLIALRKLAKKAVKLSRDLFPWHVVGSRSLTFVLLTL